MRRKMIAILIACLMLISVMSVSVEAKKSNKYNMEKVVQYIKKHNAKMVNKYLAKLPADANEKCVKKMSKKQRKAYNKLIKKRRAEDSSAYCFVTDIDKDGSAELLVQHGEYMATYEYWVYSYKNGKVKKLKNTIPGAHVGSYTYYPGHNGIVFGIYGPGGMSYAIASIKNNKVNYKVIGEFSNAELYVENEEPPLLTYSVKYVKKLL